MYIQYSLSQHYQILEVVEVHPAKLTITAKPEAGTVAVDTALASLEQMDCGHGTITLSDARSRLDQRRFSRPNTHFAAFFKIYKKITFSQANLQNFCKKFANFLRILQILEKS